MTRLPPASECPLVPRSTFSFMLCASNKFGKSDFSDMAAFTMSASEVEAYTNNSSDTPPSDGTAHRTVCVLSDTWSEVWAPSSPPYYFNAFTLETQWEHPFPEDDSDFQFRQKRFRFLFQLWQLSEDVDAKPEKLKMQLRRTHAFYDSFRCFKRFTSLQLVKGSCVYHTLAKMVSIAGA